jgi:hypothetical protein
MITIVIIDRKKGRTGIGADHLRTATAVLAGRNVYMYIYLYIYIYIYIYKHIHLYISVHTCIYVYM